MNVQTVSSLPALDQSRFPPLPELPDDTTLMALGSKLGRYEREAVLSIITTAAVRSNGWKPVSVREFLMIAQKSVPSMLFQGVINAVWELVRKGLIELIRFDGTKYIVPTTAFAAALCGSHLRYSPAVA